MSELRSKATAGVLWSGAERIGRQASSFVVQVVLARLLAPEHFGHIAMVAVFVAVAGTLVDSGLGSALIQRQVVTSRELSTVWVFNMSVAVVLTIALWLAAPWVAQFYRQEGLVWVLRGLGAGLVLNAVGSVHATMFMREMQFRRLAWITIPAAVVSGCAGIVAALCGWREWALVTQSVVQSTVASVAFWTVSPWRFRPAFDRGVLKELFPFGSRMAISAILDRIFSDAYTLTIGRLFTAVEVGLFQRAYALQQLPAANLQSILNSVSFPLLSRVRDDPTRLRRGVCVAVQLGALCSFPLFTAISISARPLVAVLLGEKWLPIVPFLQLLCLPGALYTLHAINLNLLMALGRSDLFLRLEVIKKVLVAANIILVSGFGVSALVVGMAVTSVLSLLINTHYSGQFAGYGLVPQLTDIWPSVVLSAAVAAAMALVGRLAAGLNPAIALFGMIAVAMIVMFLGFRLLPAAFRREIAELATHLPTPFRAMSAYLGPEFQARSVIQ